MNKSCKSFLSLSLCCASVLALNSNTYAATNTSTKNNISILQKQTRSQKDKYIDARKSLTKYVTRLSDGTFELNAPKNLEKQINPTILSQIKAGMNRTNILIRQGSLKSNEDRTVFTSKDTYNVQNGVTKVEHYWDGSYDIYLDSGDATRVASELGGGVALTQILNKIPGIGAAADVVGAVTGITAAEIAYANADSNGVIISYVWMDGDAYSGYIFSGASSQ
jgi:hypothetical protein